MHGSTGPVLFVLFAAAACVVVSRSQQPMQKPRRWPQHVNHSSTKKGKLDAGRDAELQSPTTTSSSQLDAYTRLGFTMLLLRVDTQ